MEAFGIFGFVMSLVAFFFATVAYSQVAGLKAELEQLRAASRRDGTPPA